MSTEFTYAVARIRAKELKLLTKKDLDMLLQSKNFDEAMRFLAEKGYGSDNKEQTSEQMLKDEYKKTWELMWELVDEKEVFSFFTVQNDFHNLKASIKAVTRDLTPDGVFMSYGNTPSENIYNAVKNRDFNALPDYLYECADNALKTLLQTSDGQLCDIIIDKACMETVYKLGKKSDNDIIKLYCELFVASANIKIAVRCNKMNKTYDFIFKSLAECESINISMLAKSAAKSLDDVYSYLSFTDYSFAISALKKSPAEFEKQCDNLLMDKMQSQKWEPFTIGPLVAYIIARDTEIKAVRLILSAKLNDLDINIIAERLRDMYV